MSKNLHFLRLEVLKGISRNPQYARELGFEDFFHSESCTSSKDVKSQKKGLQDPASKSE
ncbi:MAG: hypothetical protein HUJ54_12165 [Erysipelotrichaceae bacterium]|nr:hypothetical protein [Erysipelotrichaceae bacterium]